MINTFSKSTLLRTAQSILLRSGLTYIIKPFASGLHKIYCLAKFADWKKKQTTSSTLKGYKDRFTLYKNVIEQENMDLIFYLELGVSKGESIKWWLKEISNKKSLFVGFDTFEGIPEDWGTKPRGSYTNSGIIPYVGDSRCKFEVGLFQQTLPRFLKQNELRERLVIHFDADLYSSTLFSLVTIAPYLKKEDILIFDEFDITTHEFRAFQDFESAYPIHYDLLGESNNYNKVVIKIK